MLIFAYSLCWFSVEMSQLYRRAFLGSIIDMETRPIPVSQAFGFGFSPSLGTPLPAMPSDGYLFSLPTPH